VLVLDPITVINIKTTTMKFFRKINILIWILAASALCMSCTKETPHIAPRNTDLSNSAAVQVFSATVKATRNYIYVDGTPVSGIALAYGGIFPGTAYSFKVNAGSRSFTIKDTLPATTQVPLTFTQTMDAGKSYTIFTYDTITSTKQATVTNNIVVPTDTSSRLRFANFIYNTTPVANVDVYSFKKGTGAPLFANVATNQVTDFIPYASLQTDTLYVYAAGTILINFTTSPPIVKQVVTSTVPTRSYTSVYNGSYRGTKAVTTFATY
jgi:hypothetical protein